MIRYVAKVVTDAPSLGVGYATSIPLDNRATLTYAGGDPTVYPDRLTATETIEVRQPQMGAISKIDGAGGRTGTGTQADPYQIDIAADTMRFRLSSCNDGLAPAYGVVITDLLAPELDETDLAASPPVVKIGTTTLAAGADYTFTAPARGGEMRIALSDSAPVGPTQCLTVDYDIGFHSDLTVSKSWRNEARLLEYRSLPLSQQGRVYTPTEMAAVWMTNLVSVEQLLKTLVSPANGEATIGDEVVYRITVPAVPMNATLNNVVVTDDLHAALAYESATAVVNGTSVSLTDTSADPARVTLPSGPSVRAAGGHHPADAGGQQRPGERRHERRRYRLLHLYRHAARHGDRLQQWRLDHRRAAGDGQQDRLADVAPGGGTAHLHPEFHRLGRRRRRQLLGCVGPHD